MRAPRGFGDFYAELSAATVAYHPRLVKVTGGVTATLLLDQLLYWTPRASEAADGWIYKTQMGLEQETGLTRFEQETARKKLRDRGIIHEKKAGVPAKLYFKVDLDRLSEVYEQTYPVGESDSQDDGFPQPRMSKSRKQEQAHPATYIAANSQTISTETTNRDYLQDPPAPLRKNASPAQQPRRGRASNPQEPTTTPLTGTQAGVATEAEVGGTQEHPLDQPAEVVAWLKSWRGADENEIAFVVAELSKKPPGAVREPNAYADKCLKTYRATEAERAKNEQRLKEAAGAENPPCTHTVRTKDCTACAKVSQDAKTQIQQLIADLAAKKSA